MRPNPTSRLAWVVVMLCGVLLLSACTAAGIEFVETSKDYDAAGLETLLEATSSPELAQHSVDEISALRREALIDLRSQSAEGARAADLITRTFPDVAAVPFHVQTAKVEGTDAVLLIEAVGGEDGSLTARRLWAMNGQGDVLLSLMR